MRLRLSSSGSKAPTRRWVPSIATRPDRRAPNICFLAARHVFITPRGRPGGVVDDALARLGRARTIAFATPSFLIGPPVVADTNLVITLASRLATAFASTLPLALFESPFELPGFRVAMFCTTAVTPILCTRSSARAWGPSRRISLR